MMKVIARHALVLLFESVGLIQLRMRRKKILFQIMGNILYCPDTVLMHMLQLIFLFYL